MKVYTLKRTQILPVDIDTAWNFFSSPKNLARITPSYMKFKILHISGEDKMYPGQVIRYKLYPIPLVPFFWTTEITHVQEPFYFVDEQRTGPYALWHHQHHFKEVDGGVEMIDEVNYAIPLGILGRFSHWMFVERQLNSIFDYRYAYLEKTFPHDSRTIRTTV
jgi:ligand-binding SRPBCC domain-containing protein